MSLIPSIKQSQSNPKVIYKLEERGGQHLYHFIIYNIGGLIYILNEQTNPNICNIPVYMQRTTKFQIEAFDILKDKFTLITDISKEKDYIIKQIFGVPCTAASGHVGDNLEIFAPAIRKLFLDRIPDRIFDKNKRIFITRTKSETFHYGQLRRCVMNEEQLKKDVLEKHNIQYIRLEEYSFEEKIRLFNSSSLILSSLGGALACIVFANKKTKIVEMLNNGPIDEVTHHYSNLTSKLNLPYYRYSNIVEDNWGNFNVNTQDLNNYLEQIVFKT